MTKGTKVLANTATNADNLNQQVAQSPVDKANKMLDNLLLSVADTRLNDEIFLAQLDKLGLKSITNTAGQTEVYLSEKLAANEKMLTYFLTCYNYLLKQPDKQYVIAGSNGKKQVITAERTLKNVVIVSSDSATQYVYNKNKEILQANNVFALAQEFASTISTMNKLRKTEYIQSKRQEQAMNKAMMPFNDDLA
jgi:hypothetical protein